MNRRPWGSARDMVAAYAKAHPDARPCDIARALDLLPEYVSTAIRRLKRPVFVMRQRTKMLHGAAPELLAVLQKIVWEFGGSIEQYHKLGPDWTMKDGTETFNVSVVLDREELIEEARAAIAKAGAQ